MLCKCPSDVGPARHPDPALHAGSHVCGEQAGLAAVLGVLSCLRVVGLALRDLLLAHHGYLALPGGAPEVSKTEDKDQTLPALLPAPQHGRSMGAHTGAHAHVHIHAHTHPCTRSHLCTHSCTHICAHAHIPVDTHALMHTFAHLCTHTHAPMHTLTHLCMHTPVHTLAPPCTPSHTQSRGLCLLPSPRRLRTGVRILCGFGSRETQVLGLPLSLILE